MVGKRFAYFPLSGTYVYLLKSSEEICKIPNCFSIMSGYRGNRRGRGVGSRGSYHPSHLKGKEIGLFYARRSKEKAEEREKEQVKKKQTNEKYNSISKQVFWNMFVVLIYNKMYIKYLRFRAYTQFREPPLHLCLQLSVIYALNLLMPTVNQKAVFNRPPPGIRKIILATNIAETSITIDDIVFVIDSGKIKISSFDVENNIATLKPDWIALANARQRRGRAGRVQEGICYHLYTKLRESQLQNYQLPEILRTRLETLCLRIKLLKLGKIELFLKKAMQPPDPKAVALSINLLEKLNALDEDENLTPLGFHLAQLPLDPHTGKMILMGAIFSCLDPILTVAANLSFKDAFVIPLGKEEQADWKRKQIAQNSKSDHLMLVQAFNGWEVAMEKGYDQQYCWENFLSHSTLKMLANLKKQFAQYLHELQFLHCDDFKHKDFNRNSENQMLLKAVICAGLYPNVAKLQWHHNRNPHKGPKIPKVYTEDDGKVVLHPKSVNYMELNFHTQWLVYYQKLKSTKVFLHDTTNIQPLALLFFGGQITLGEDLSCHTVFIDKYIAFHCPPKVAHLMKELREELDKLLQHKANYPGVACWDPSTTEGALLKAIVELITSEDPLQAVECTSQDDDNE
ncbi:ATP-dependent DNA/RNA helicase DHX36-like [Tachypleus tridentatus]|uniref:ATP-dependent DNA/RNA helicase DHX36-like n=1 Tax=Tachypleus tridentatus TaxID=6853 RepID=UPI003FD6691A